jgi:uncharacterized protein YggE
MPHTAAKSTYVRVALAADTALSHALSDAPNRAARLLELATMGLALQKVATASQMVHRPPTPLAFAKQTASEQERMAAARRVDDELMEIWSKR